MKSGPREHPRRQLLSPYVLRSVSGQKQLTRNRLLPPKDPTDSTEGPIARQSSAIQDSGNAKNIAAVVTVDNRPRRTKRIPRTGQVLVFEPMSPSLMLVGWRHFIRAEARWLRPGPLTASARNATNTPIRCKTRCRLVVDSNLALELGCICTACEKLLRYRERRQYTENTSYKSEWSVREVNR